MTGSNQDYVVTPGLPEPRGVSISGDGVNVAVFSAYAEAIDICLFDDTGTVEVARIRLPDRTGDVFHGHIARVAAGTRYGLRAHGPYDPHAGHRFNPAKLLLDPQALAIDRPFSLEPAMFGFAPGTGGPDLADSAAVMPKAVVVSPTPAAPWCEALPWEQVVIAELHVRGFTMLHPGVPEAQRGTFAGLASPAAVQHLKGLGITTVELLPAAASLDERHLKPLGLRNYWNYNPVAYLAPDPRLAPGGWDEIRAATATLNAAGIEVILDVVFNHSGESDAEGPTVSLRGLDNASYYRLDLADPARYIDDAGCGNILAADHPAVVRLVMDSLRAWARFGGINGFRFDLATTLGRRRSGFDASAPLLSAIEQDPVLQPLRLIAEPWDIGPGGYQVGAFSGRWGEWNDKYRDDVRRFWRGDGLIADLATRLSGSTDRFWFKRKPSRSINFITAHDGFTLADLVSYAGKHNEANGEHNRDGTNDNQSWNNGIEGPTDDPAILAARRRDQRNLLATLMLSRGTPMLGPGSETGQTQGGNNNAYAQDNAISWTDWARADAEQAGFVALLTALRAANPALTRDRFLTGADVDGTGIPDVVWRLADGRAPGGAWTDARQRTLVAELEAPDRSGGVNRVLAVFHAGRSGAVLVLPETRPACVWRLALDTGIAATPPERLLEGETEFPLEPRTVLLFIEEQGIAERGGRRVVASEVLDRLALAAGVAPEWFEVNGTRHAVMPDTKRALLAAMGLAVGSTGEARDSLAELAALRDRRTLPRTLAGRAGRPVALRLAEPPGAAVRLRVDREDGSTETVTVDLAASAGRIATACDGRPVPVVDAMLPPQPVGRHRVTIEGVENSICNLTVAPTRCFLPDRLQGRGRAFGLAAHLYTLRGPADAGIGDFAVLGDFAAAAARHRAELVGINPIHALFGNHRDRASPYHPSDRRFLDPIYIDVASPDLLALAPEVPGAVDRLGPTFATLRAERLVDYPAVWAAKKAVLEAAFQAFDGRARRRKNDSQAQGFAAFVQVGGPALQRFATFEAIAETIPDRDWMGWPEGLRRPDSPEVAAFAGTAAARVRFHLFLQWVADTQLAAAAARGAAAGLDIGLYRDLAVGCAPDGAENWSEPWAYAKGVSVGSPPDPFSATGQIWCLPPPNPLAPDRFGRTLLGPLLQANMRHAGALRIDHAMGLSRLFWVPDNAPGSAGAYVGADFEANLAEVALESHRARCLVVGEDLGTVQEGFRGALERNDILSYRVLFFEREGLGFKPAASYPHRAVACVATHDIAPLAGWWTGADIAERQAVGQIDEGAASHAMAERAVERHDLAAAVGDPSLANGPAEPTLRAVHRFIAETPSMLVVAQMDDLVGEKTGVNLPGTDRERPNWRRRLPLDTDALFAKVEADATLPDLPLREGPEQD